MASGNGGVGVGGNCGESESSDSLRTFGAVLKALRDEARLTQEQFAPLVQYSAAYIAKIEQGKRFPPRDLLDRSEEVLGPTAGRVLSAASRSLTRKVGLASWFLQWAAVEEEAISLLSYESSVIPGLLQPEPYIRALFDRRLPPSWTSSSSTRCVPDLSANACWWSGQAPHSASSSNRPCWNAAWEATKSHECSSTTCSGWAVCGTWRSRPCR